MSLTGPNIVDILNSAIGQDRVLMGMAIGQRYISDCSGIGTARPLAVVLPHSTNEVSTILQVCNKWGQTVVPQGGMTGLAGGAVPEENDICLSLERMRGIEEIDRAAATMTVLAGTNLQTVHEAAIQAGFEFPVDMGSRGSCQIGGALATNAGGIRVIQSGTARENVVGLEVVLADGAVLSSIGKIIKNNTGYDLKHWFIGSEGTLGVITRAVLRLRPKPFGRHTALCALPGYRAMAEFLARMRTALGGELAAFEIMWPDFFEFGVELSRAKCSPFGRPYALYALVEQSTLDPEDSGRRFTEILSAVADGGTILDAVVAHSTSERKALWEIRECTAEFPSRLAPINFDISVPIGDIGSFVTDCKEMLSSLGPNHRSFFFGHLGDFNLHVTVDANSIPGVARAAVEDALYALIARYRGSISAEHGIGLLKREYLHHSRTASELRAMWAIKKALDPKGILNPGKVLPEYQRPIT
jgi:FAD/FMN-containing dehydrogenase